MLLILWLVDRDDVFGRHRMEQRMGGFAVRRARKMNSCQGLLLAFLGHWFTCIKNCIKSIPLHQTASHSIPR
jgi:hypothetical protein